MHGMGDLAQGNVAALAQLTALTNDFIERLSVLFPQVAPVLLLLRLRGANGTASTEALAACPSLLSAATCIQSSMA
jgi:hypothetical protein